MDWSNERYVRFYTRDTTTWKLFSWQARCLLALLLRKVDRAGVLEVGDTGIEGLAAMVEVPLDVVKIGARDLMRRGTLEETEGGFVLPKFIEAQETRQSDPARARESRERRRSETLRKTAKSAESTERDVTAGDETVTTRHQASHAVTPSEPDQTTPSETPARTRAIPPTAVPAPTTEPPRIKSAIAPTPAISTAAEIRSPGIDPRWVGRVAVELWRGVSADRLAVAAELGLANVLPLPECDSPREPGAFRELRDRLREEGAAAEVVAKHVRAALLERGRAERSVEWLAEKAFTEGGWRTARSYVPGAAKRAKPGTPPAEMRVVRCEDDPPPLLPAAGSAKS